MTNHQEIIRPYISPERDLETERSKPIPQKNLIRLSNGLLPGDIILLWRIAFGTFTTQTVFPKYFEYTYGIHAPSHLEQLVEKGYVKVESAFDSLDHISSPEKKDILKNKGITGLSKMKAKDLDMALVNAVTEEELGHCFTVRGLVLTELGQRALDESPQVVDAHPKKKF